MEDIEGTAEGPRKDELAVASDGAIGSDAVWALKHPVRHIFATDRPKETETDAVRSFVNAHVPSRRGGMVRREDVSTQRKRDDD